VSWFSSLGLCRRLNEDDDDDSLTYCPRYVSGQQSSRRKLSVIHCMLRATDSFPTTLTTKLFIFQDEFDQRIGRVTTNKYDGDLDRCLPQYLGTITSQNYSCTCNRNETIWSRLLYCATTSREERRKKVNQHDIDRLTKYDDATTRANHLVSVIPLTQ
jgi:hypothetical protein